MLKVETFSYYQYSVNLASVVLSQYTRVTDNDDEQHNNSQTLKWNCNVPLKHY